MPLQKQSVPINFAMGLDTKTDPWQVDPGKFLALQNTVFTKGKLLQKRNGYGALNALSNNASTYLTTFNGNLTALGTTVSAYSQDTNSWVYRGALSPIEVATLPLIRNNFNQTQCDSAVASNGLVCTVYTEVQTSGTVYRYVIADSNTGQNIIPPSQIPATPNGVTQSARVFVLGAYFIIVFTNFLSSVYHLQYTAISTTNPTNFTPNVDISPAYTPSSTVSWDGVVAGNYLYIGFNTTVPSQRVSVVSLSSILFLSNAVFFTGSQATMMSLCADMTVATNPLICVNFYSSSTSTGFTAILDRNLATVLGPTEIITTGSIVNMASAAQNALVSVYLENPNTYGFDSGIPTNFITKVTITSTGTVTLASQVVRSVGLASKAFIVNGVEYFLSAYESSFQPTYFLINGSTSTAVAPIVVAKIAYENGGGYLTLGLPNVTLLNGNVAYVPYLYKDLIEALSTNNTSDQSTAGGVYSQTGINLATFTIGTKNTDTAEIGSDLLLTGGFLWMYDGYLPVEQNFFLWPDHMEVSSSSTGGNIEDDTGFYIATYEWSDNQGNIYRSAPSIPAPFTTTGGGTSTNTINVPTLRLTYKTANPVKIVLYRWSAAQQTYYQVTSITSPEVNVTSTDYLAITDTLNASTISGNNILYTTGGIVEDINAPSSNILTLFDTRLWLVDAEDPNVLWFSKQVIENTPVEMSDLFTVYIAPNIGTTSSSGPMTALAPMDDKLVIFKKNAIYYINGTGPDNTGANNQYSQPIFITSTVGCSNQASLVLMPQGLMFQSDKGIWLLGRDLSTSYIGAPVEEFNSSSVNSAANIPATNQVRFTLSTGQTLMYDYYYGQWGTFVNVPAISSTIYNNLHTYLNSSGAVFQETPGEYLDGSNPVLMSFLTSWINLAGLQGFERAYFFYILGQYISPHKLNVQIAYDYNPTPTQASLITPDNYTSPWGGEFNWGAGQVWGGSSNVEQWRVILQKGKCQSFQVSINEVFDYSFGVDPGAGLTISGLNLIVGTKKGYPTLKPSRTVG